LSLDDGGVAGLFEGFGVIAGVHHEEIVAAREDDGFLVGRNGSPQGLFAHGLDVVQASDFAGG
jgi:hypothetical protein